MSNSSSVLHHRMLGSIALQRGVATLANLGLLGTAALVVGRRASGALTQPLTPSQLTLATAVVAIVALGVRRVWSLDQRDSDGWRERLPWIVVSLAAVAFVLGLCLPGTRPWGIVAALGILAAEEVLVWGRLGRQAVGNNRPLVPSVEQSIAQVSLPAVRSLPNIETVESEDDFPAEDVLQKMTRSRTADGTEEAFGWLRMQFVAGQRTGNLHVAFCPPFDSSPELLFEQLDGPETRIKVAQVLPHGARLDLKLTEVTEESTSVLLQFSARADSESK